MSFHPWWKYLPFCPHEQCPLHMFSLESSRLVSSFTVLAQGDPFVLSLDNWDIHRPASLRTFQKSDSSTFVFPQNTWVDTPLSTFPLPFVCPYLLSSCFIYLFIYFLLFFFHSFTLLLLLLLLLLL